jgi:hypothetical protein
MGKGGIQIFVTFFLIQFSSAFKMCTTDFSAFLDRNASKNFPKKILAINFFLAQVFRSRKELEIKFLNSIFGIFMPLESGLKETGTKDDY